MGSIIGFGGWSPYYYYLIVSSLTKIIKEDIILENSTKLPFDLKIVNHQLMILLLGYMSDFFFALLIYLLTLYLEYKRKRQKSLQLSSEGIEYEKKSTLELLVEFKNKKLTPDNNNLDKRKNDEVSIDNETFKNNNSLNFTKTNSSLQKAKKISLIHTDLLENISDNSFKYLVLSTCLIVAKEFLYQIVYTSNDIFDFYFINLIILTLILKFWYKENIYRHRMLTIIMVVIVSGTCFISCLFINNYSQNEKKRSIIDIFNGKIYKIIILIVLYLILSFCFCTGIVIQKNLMEYKFISPLKILFSKGISGIISAIIGLTITTKFKCNEELSMEKEDITEMKFFEFFVCSNEYNNNYYYDHFISYFKSFNNGRFKEGILLSIYSILHFFTELSLILTNKYLSPTHYLIAESMFSLIHIPLNYLSNASYDEIKNEMSNKEKINIINVYNAIIQTFGTRILKFIACFFDFIGYIIYLEIIELKFCELNKNLKKNIEKRASIEGNIENNDDNTSEGSDDENEENKKEKI